MKEEMRKIVQVAASDNSVAVLCNDGSVWIGANDVWQKLPDIPQPWEEEDNAC